MKGWIVKLLTIRNEVYCMGVAVWGVVCGGLGGRGLEINIIKIQKHIIIYFRVSFLILLFTYVNLYLLVLLFILSFIVLYGG